MHRQNDLPHVVRALRPASGFAGGLHRRQEQSNEDADDGDDDEQLDERETASKAARGGDHSSLRRKWIEVGGTCPGGCYRQENETRSRYLPYCRTPFDASASKSRPPFFVSRS
jgi:hypothetical protein